MGRISCELRIKRFLTRYETTITQPQNLTDVTHRPFSSHRKWLIVRRCICLSTRGEELLIHDFEFKTSSSSVNDPALC